MLLTFEQSDWITLVSLKCRVVRLDKIYIYKMGCFRTGYFAKYIYAYLCFCFYTIIIN